LKAWASIGSTGSATDLLFYLLILYLSPHTQGVEVMYFIFQQYL